MSKPYKVFGIGLNKTGTSSLKRALVTLGYRHCDLRGRMTQKYFNNNFEEIFNTVDEFDAFEDWPWPLMYRKIFAEYGDGARFILTRRRQSRDWLDSLKAHSMVTNPDNNPRKRVYGFDYPHGAEAEHLAFYDRHLSDVRQFFADQYATHLLLEVCWEEADGWSQVCDFLGEPIPDRTFPHVNRRVSPPKNKERLAENERRIAAQIARLTN